jgi:hypothetical protein
MHHLFLIALCLAFPLEAMAGEIAGRVLIKHGGGSQPLKDAAVIVSCGEGSTQTAMSRRDGFYRALGPAIHGNCTVRVDYDNRSSNPIRVTIAGDTRVVLVVERSGDGLSLSRG